MELRQNLDGDRIKLTGPNGAVAYIDELRGQLHEAKVNAAKSTCACHCDEEDHAKHIEAELSKAGQEFQRLVAEFDRQVSEAAELFAREEGTSAEWKDAIIAILG